MPDTDIETERQVRRLEEQFKRLSITDSEGDIESGFAIRQEISGIGESVGACCFPDLSCRLLSSGDCFQLGGIYHGDQSSCYPNPCTPTTECSCSNPSAYCPHAICFEINFDESEVGSGSTSADLVDLWGFPNIGAFIDWSSNLWTIYSDYDSVTVPLSRSGFSGVWHCVKIQFWSNGDGTGSFHATIDGVGSSIGIFFHLGDILSFTKIEAGAVIFSTGINHHSIRNLNLLANPGTPEVSFLLPPTSFDSLTGTGISESGGVLTVDNAGTNASGTKNLDPAFCFTCNCGSPCFSPSDRVTITLSGLISCGCVALAPFGSGSVTATPTSLDGTYVLSYTGDFGGPIFEYFDLVTHVMLENWGSDDCGSRDGDEPLPPSVSTGLHILVHCDPGNDDFTVFVQSPYVGISPNYQDFIYFGGLFNGTAVPNQNSCGSFSSSYGFIHGGSATVSW